MNAFGMHAISPNTALQTYDIADHTILGMCEVWFVFMRYYSSTLCKLNNVGVGWTTTLFLMPMFATATSFYVFLYSNTILPGSIFSSCIWLYVVCLCFSGSPCPSVCLSCDLCLCCFGVGLGVVCVRGLHSCLNLILNYCILAIKYVAKTHDKVVN